MILKNKYVHLAFILDEESIKANNYLTMLREVKTKTVHTNITVIYQETHWLYSLRFNKKLRLKTKMNRFTLKGMI